MEVHVHARPFVVAALTGLCLAATAGASTDGASSVRFGFVPQKAFPGQPASLSVVVRPTGVRCSASIRYADASLHRLPSVVARAGKASWRWTIPPRIKLGSASADAEGASGVDPIVIVVKLNAQFFINRADGICARAEALDTFDVKL